jgi:hypothetical protein
MARPIGKVPATRQEEAHQGRSHNCGAVIFGLYFLAFSL